MRSNVQILMVVAETLAAGISVAHADIQVDPAALSHYSNCVTEAKDRNRVYFFDRGVMYRCTRDIAASYFNYLERMKVREYSRSVADGSFVYRSISGVGACWHKIEERGLPVSFFGCDVYVAY